MNGYDIESAHEMFATDPVFGPLTRTLVSLRDCADSNSDGWAYWPKPARAASKLMDLIERRRWESREATPAEVRKALTPIKAFRTRSGLQFEIYEP